jgi:hypothetical protein
MLKDKRKGTEKQAKTEELESYLVKYLKPILSRLNAKMDRRLVKTFLGLVMAIMEHRHRNNGLLLSELGGYLLGSEFCCAGIPLAAGSSDWAQRRSDLGPYALVDYAWRREKSKTGGGR